MKMTKQTHPDAFDPTLVQNKRSFFVYNSPHEPKISLYDIKGTVKTGAGIAVIRTDRKEAIRLSQALLHVDNLGFEKVELHIAQDGDDSIHVLIAGKKRNRK